MNEDIPHTGLVTVFYVSDMVSCSDEFVLHIT